MFKPERQRGFEYLDDPALPVAIAERSLQDVALSNYLFGGTRAVVSAMRDECARAKRDRVKALTLLDVGTGMADIPAAVIQVAYEYQIAVTAFGLEMSQPLAAIAGQRSLTAVAGDARSLPFATNSVDIVTCSQVLHHFPDGEAQTLLAECSRVARRAVIVADLQRSWAAMALLWLVSFPLRFHPVSRHDGVASIRRGFTVRELDQTVRRAGARNPRTQNRLGWRVTAVWNPGNTTA